MSEEQLDAMVREVVVDGGARFVTTFCTNLRTAQRVEYWERVHEGVVVFDTVATVVWDMLKMAGLEAGLVKGWGRLFAGPGS